MQTKWQNNGITRGVLAVVGAALVGYFWLKLTIPFMMGVFVSNDLNTPLGMNHHLAFGLATGVMICVLSAFVAAWVATPFRSQSLDGPPLASLAVAVTVGSVPAIKAKRVDASTELNRGRQDAHNTSKET
ncbi:hypothetical protein [Aporhodopirellula aestuarii]|uniref:Uncharacterized protein n=1 Tax=Aporhodopirellula aestuarii TaxID=2950107 RepID=A0ABT0U6E1_9BACT|nr:hypothetical protein [Aporhodopirellula aestuarii]MCM2371891.1 hypothetical protein [Aporhodopirellula aestuarii]